MGKKTDVPCPKCGRPMSYGQYGVKGDWTPAMGWRCIDCWKCIWEDGRPWSLTITGDVWLRYVSECGCGPSEHEGRPRHWAEYDQPRLF